MGTAPAGELPPEELVGLMVGRELAGPKVGRSAVGPEMGRDPAGEKDPAPALSPKVVLEVAGLRVAHPRVPTRSVVAGLGFTLRKGEILAEPGRPGAVCLCWRAR